MDTAFFAPTGGAAPLAPASYTWATRPSAVGLAGSIIRVTDVGNGESGTGGGSYFFSNGVRWKPVNNNFIADAIDTANVGVANTTEQQLNPNHVALPAGLTANGDRLRILIGASKSGGSDSATMRLRFGPLGTTSDPVIATITTLAGANQSAGYMLLFKRLSATTIQKQGNADTSSSYAGAGTAAYPAAVAVSDMSANAMFLSITQQMTGGTEFVTVQDYSLEFIATDGA